MVFNAHVYRFALHYEHPGFREELEWRVVYQPSFDESEHILPEITSIRGLPQTIQKIPLRSVPNSKFDGR